MEGANRPQAARPLSSSSHALQNPDFLLHSPARIQPDETMERVVLPQTLRRPAPKTLAAASFSHAIASPLLWRCHLAGQACHAIFFWDGGVWPIVSPQKQKYCVVEPPRTQRRLSPVAALA
jgi:hypothetical protein